MTSSNRNIVSVLARVACRWLPVTAALVLLGAMSGCATGVVHSKAGTTTTVILIRHGDINEHSEVLNERGQERAKALVDAVRDMRITAIYSPDVRRNLDTVGPLAKQRGIEITLTPVVSLLVAKEISQEIVTKHAGGVVLWVGNRSGNLQAVYQHLGGTGTGPVEYGDLFIMTIPDKGEAKVVRKRFGPDTRQTDRFPAHTNTWYLEKSS
jgi:hypothetical protein